MGFERCEKRVATSSRGQCRAPVRSLPLPRRHWQLHVVDRRRCDLRANGPRTPYQRALVRSVQEARHNIDRQPDDHGAKQKRKQCVPQGKPSDRLRLQIRVGDLEGQADRE